VRKDLNLTKDSLIDNQVPVMHSRQARSRVAQWSLALTPFPPLPPSSSHLQVVLDRALQFWMRKVANGSADLEAGADRMLKLMDDMQLEMNMETLGKDAH